MKTIWRLGPGRVEEDEPELDRHSPLFLFGEGVGIDPGQGPDQGALAVVDVAGRADNEMGFFGVDHVRIKKRSR